MGSSSSKALEESVRATPLETLASPLVVVDPVHCSDAPRSLLIKHTVTGGDMTITATHYDGAKSGDVVYRVNGDRHFALYNSADDLVCEILHHGSGCRVVNGSSMFYSARLPVPFQPKEVGVFKHVQKQNVPVVIGEVTDRQSGQRFRIGYTGTWAYKHTAVIWLANEKTPTEHVAIARVVPSGRCGMSVSYCLEIAPGVDASILMMVIAVLDVGATMPYQIPAPAITGV
ncbi:hypothetical protein PINS_up013676 [Pythium insidiosum]|nr:hypothetical protein PINS_up013676 [Pythium insidiosum]